MRVSLLRSRFYSPPRCSENLALMPAGFWKSLRSSRKESMRAVSIGTSRYPRQSKDLRQVLRPFSDASERGGFVTMLAPLRDCLSPKDQKLSLLLCTIGERYFTRMSGDVHPSNPNFGETPWTTSENANVEHLLDIFTTVDSSSDSVTTYFTTSINRLCDHDYHTPCPCYMSILRDLLHFIPCNATKIGNGHSETEY